MGARSVGFLDYTCLAMWPGWADVLFLGFASRVGRWKGLDVVGKELWSHTLDALERSADIALAIDPVLHTCR